MSVRDLTTNVAECWNSVNKLYTVAKPNLWCLIKTFLREECAAKAKYASIVTGVRKDPNPGRTRKRLDRKDHLKDLVEKFPSMELADFMAAVASFFND